MAFIYFISNIFVIKFYVRNAHTSETHFARSMRTAAVKYTELTCKDPVSCQSPDHPAQSYTATSSRDFLKWWKWESIGAACVPRCGGCCCGNCQPGGKEMTLAGWKRDGDGERWLDVRERGPPQPWTTLACQVSVDRRSSISPQQQESGWSHILQNGEAAGEGTRVEEGLCFTSP